MTEARYRIYSRKTEKPVCIMALLPTEAHLYLHVCRAQLHMMLWQAANQHGPPKVDITRFGWEVKGGILSPCVNTGLPAPHSLIDVLNCGCKSDGKAYSTES